LARYWSVIQVGETKSSSFGQWQIRWKEFRENLESAVIVPGDHEASPGVMQLLEELSLAESLSGDCVLAAGNG
jgi:hypothetical protein